MVTINTLCLAAVLSGGMLYALHASAHQSLTEAEPAPSQQVVLAGQTFKLEEQQKRCALRKPDQSVLILKISWPCQFSQDRTGTARVEVFQSTPIVLATHNQPETAPGIVCAQTTQAIRLRNGDFETSSVNQAANCWLGHDQKMFTALFDW